MLFLDARVVLKDKQNILQELLNAKKEGPWEIFQLCVLPEICGNEALLKFFKERFSDEIVNIYREISKEANVSLAEAM